jgi:hypothetical protein
MPDYGERYRAGQRISTGFVESAVNEIVAKRMVKKQQMRWNRYILQRFLDIRIHVLNDTIPSVAHRLPAGREPNQIGSHSMITPQLCTLSRPRKALAIRPTSSAIAFKEPFPSVALKNSSILTARPIIRRQDDPAYWAVKIEPYRL